MKRTLLLATLILLGLAGTAGAQESSSFMEKIRGWITPKPLILNPEAIWQPPSRWNVSVTGGLRQAGEDQIYKMAVETPNAPLPVTLISRMEDNLEPTLGVSAGYGKLSAGFSRRLGSGGSKNTTLSFDYMTSGYAFQLQYFRFNQPMEYEIILGSPGEDRYMDEKEMSEIPAKMNAFIADAFYAFNRLNFAYSAVYKGNVIQRRSAGSVMFAMKFIRGMVEDTPKDVLPFWDGGFIRQTTTQISFGGGMSYNWVPYHRDPVDDWGHGLRNLTFNVTAIPLVTLFNQFFTQMEVATEGGGLEPWENVMNGRMLVNYVARAGASYTFDRFAINLSGSYDSFSCNGDTSFPGFDGAVATSGGFHRWTVTLQTSVKF